MPVREWIAQTLHVLAASLLVISVVVMAVQVTLRLAFNSPLSWPEEAVRYFFVWSVFLGSTVAVTRGTHIRVMVAVENRGPFVRRLSDMLDWAVNVICFGYLAWWGADLAYKYKDAEFYTLGGWSQLWYYLALPVPAVIAVAFLLAPGGRTVSAEPPSETRL